jgi:magnesium-transporting ATPase (P-type)
MPTHDDRHDFNLERYKYILAQIQMLNENVYKYITLFQTLATAVLGGMVWVFANWKSLGMNPDAARLAIQALTGLFMLLALFVVILILSGLFSWFDYRKEEVELLNNAAGKDFRRPPSLKNFWRWRETYIVLFIIVIVIVVTNYIQTQVLLLIV